MKKLLIAIALTVSLAGCATNPYTQIETKIAQVVTPDNYDTISAAYGAALAVAVGYRNLCERKVINKSCWKTIEKLQPYELKAYNAYIVLRDYVRKYPNADASNLIATARSLINAFTSQQTALGVK